MTLSGAAVSGPSVAELRRRYDFPTGYGGDDQTVAIIELAGGYRQADLAAFAERHDFTLPPVSDVAIGEGTNDPADPELVAELASLLAGDAEITPDDASRIAPALPTFETTMDIEIVAAFAPRCRIQVVFTENSERGLWNALSTLVHDQEPQPTVLNLSWSWNETEEIRSDGTVNPLVRAIDGLLRDAANLGMTFCTSSGDDGSAPDAAGLPSVHFPASAPSRPGLWRHPVRRPEHHRRGAGLVAALQGAAGRHRWRRQPDLRPARLAERRAGPCRADRTPVHRARSPRRGRG